MKKKRRNRLIAFTVVLFYTMGIFAAIDAAMTTRTSQGAIAWSVSLVTIPYVAVPAYMFFGRNKFEGMAEAFEQSNEEISEVQQAVFDSLAPWRIPTGEAPSWHLAINRLSDMELLRGNHADLLIDGKATFDSILEGVSAAREYVLFQFYMFHDDGLGRRVKAALTERARAGVRVYVLYDEIGSSGLPDEYVEDLRAAGVEVSAFKPTQGWRNRFQLNFRNHRKMVVVDGKTGWVGGHNVGDEYLGLDPEFSPWRDTHVRISGPAVLQLQLVILSDWFWATRQIPDVNWAAQPAAAGDVLAMVLPTAPTREMETASLFFVSALSGARNRIWLSAPYFVPDDAVMKALQLAALRGVDVRILTTGKPDSLPVHLASFHSIHELRNLGIRFYAYKPGFLHQKAFLVDENIASVGTHNFDNRSFRLNFEVTAIIVDKDFGREMQEMFEADFAHSEMIDPGAFDAQPYWWQAAVRLFRLAAPVL